MSNFAHDWLSLLAGKSDARPPTLPAHQQVTAAEYNALVSAVNDLRTECWTGGINVLSFGADRTGTTDAAPAINAAIQSMRTGERNGTVFLPPGKYRLSSPLIVESSMTLQGAGGLTLASPVADTLYSANQLPFLGMVTFT